MLAGALLCARLALWQLARLAVKRALNDRMAESLAAPPVPLGGVSQPVSELLGRRVQIVGQYDESRQMLLSGVVREGEPGVRVVTPMMLPSGGAVLVDRGWLPAPDAFTARPQAFPEPGTLSVVGVAEPLAAGVQTPAWRTLADGGMKLWSVHIPGWDSVQTHFPYPVARFTLLQLPAAGLPARPLRTAPEPAGTTMHLSYAIQWFLFAAAFVAGALFVALRPESGRAAQPRA